MSLLWYSRMKNGVLWSYFLAIAFIAPGAMTLIYFVVIAPKETTRAETLSLSARRFIFGGSALILLATAAALLLVALTLR